MVSGGHERGSRRPILEVVFFRTETGSEPVRDWLRGLAREDRKAVGEDIKTAQFGWPMGMPLIRKLASGLWEVRSRISSGITRVIFTVDGQTMVLLHGFQKKLSFGASKPATHRRFKTSHHVGGVGRKNPLVRTGWQGVVIRS